MHAGSVGMVRALCHNSERCISLKPSLLPVYLQRVLNSRDRVPQEDLQAYAQLLAALSPDELADPVLPTAVRMMKRLPENVLPSVAALLQHVQVDLSQHAPQLMQDLIPQLRHVKEPIRFDLSDLFCPITSSCQVLTTCVCWMHPAIR